MMRQPSLTHQAPTRRFTAAVPFHAGRHLIRSAPGTCPGKARDLMSDRGPAAQRRDSGDVMHTLTPHLSQVSVRCFVPPADKRTHQPSWHLFVAIPRADPFVSEMAHVLPSGIPEHGVSRRRILIITHLQERTRPRRQGKEPRAWIRSLRCTTSSFLLARGGGPSCKRLRSPLRPVAQGPEGWLWAQLWLQPHPRLPLPEGLLATTATTLLAS